MFLISSVKVYLDDTFNSKIIVSKIIKLNFSKKCPIFVWLILNFLKIIKMKKIILLVVAIMTISVVPQFANAKNATPPKSKSSAQKSKQEVYPVTLPTMSLIGITSTCDGTVDGRRNVLAQLWTTFGDTQSFKKDPAIYRKKIFVLYYNHSKETGSYSIFIGYLFNNWLRSEINVKNKSAVVLDIPTNDYWAYDSRGTSADALIKSWDVMYTTNPKDVNNRGMEVMTLDSDNYSVENVTLYLKK